MRWSNVKLILAREIRDQLRDRRTMFMIVVLPILLYPLLGMSMLQFSQFAEEKSRRVMVIGARNLPDEPALIEADHFAPRLFKSPEQAQQLILTFADAALGSPAEELDARSVACDAVGKGNCDAVLYIPPDFGRRLEAFREAIRKGFSNAAQGGGTAGVNPVQAAPKPEIIYSTAYQKSQLAFAPLQKVLRQWNVEILKSNLAAAKLPDAMSVPLEPDVIDVADKTGYRGSAIWSSLLPIILILWALTGAFYPAVDLCAGEKERGTLETLLSSPAQRSEIVLGKLLTIMLFSGVTAALNLLSMTFLGSLVFGRMHSVGPPPLASMAWLAVALVPVSALFSALCLALAAFARSSKEGQYYLMPLLLVTMPLAILPAVSGMEFNFGTSLIPVTGIALLLRAALEGHYAEAAQYLLPVSCMTLVCCLLAIRWAIEQFNSESVLFRESERLELGLRLRHIFSDRQPTPSVGLAAFCGITILLVYFFMSFALPSPTGLNGVMATALITQLVVVLLPAALMTALFTGSPRQTLLLRLPPWRTVPAAIALAVAMHPVASGLRTFVLYLYPINPAMKHAMEGMQEALAGASGWQVLLIAALLPALCEELAFRGFILSGFRHLGHKWRAIVYTALFFGLTHGVLQQSLIAALIGVVIGLLAVQSGSIVPGMLYHAIHNSLPLLAARIPDDALSRWPLLDYFIYRGADNEIAYRWPVLVAGGLAAAAILIWFQRLPCRQSEEEASEERIRHAAAEAD